MNTREIPLVFECEGSELVGVVHVPERLLSRGLLFVVAGGSQYRGGMCRMQVEMARDWAASGVPVMRFDHRGLGDSSGEFQGFEHVEADIRAAIRVFLKQIPDMQEVVLWGGCDAASATIINAWKYPEVTGVILGNPWVKSESTGDQVAIKHFGRRMHDKDFWLKVMRLQYNPLPALVTIARGTFSRLRKRVPWPGLGAPTPPEDDSSRPFLSRMREGLSRFNGDVLMLMSGRSLVSQEFDELVAGDRDWQAAMRSPRRLTRHVLPDADQAFSTLADRAEVAQASVAWLLETTSPLATVGPVATVRAPAP